MKGFLAGILITLGAFVYLNVGGVIGALFFAFGIICIVKLQIPLYTGVAGTEIKFEDKLTVLLHNIIGAIIASILLILVSKEEVINTAQTISLSKVQSSWYVTLIKAIMCGAIVDISVFLSKKDGNVIPLIFGIPLFILCGFNHSIADVGYLIIGATNDTTNFNMIIYYIVCVIGNYIGCNLRRFTFYLDNKK